MKYSPGMFNFLEEISSLSHSAFSLYFFALITEERFLISLLFFGTLHSDAYIFPFLFGFSLLFFSQLFVRPPQRAIVLFCISFPWGWSWSLSPVQCNEPQWDITSHQSEWPSSESLQTITAGKGVGEREHLQYWWECKLIQPLWKMVWRFLKKQGIKPP